MTNFSRKSDAVTRRAGSRGFTIVEAMIVMALMVVLITATLGSIFSMQLSSTRVADYNSAMAIVEAKMNDIRAVYYNPPVFPFTTNSTVSITNLNSVSLNQAGTTFMVPGTIISTIQYYGSMGHLISVTATFKTPRLPMTLSLQTMVNKYSGGEQ